MYSNDTDVGDARGDAGIRATIKSTPQEAERTAKISEGYYQTANSSLSLGPASLYILLNTLTEGRTKAVGTQLSEAGADNTSISV